MNKSALWGRVVRLGLAVGFCAALNSLAQSAGECQTKAVPTESGEVCGKLVGSQGKTVSAFLGIPYAESTAGERRWQPPLPKAPWPGRFQATRFGPICPQNDSFGVELPQSEDCLSLNVWTPDTAPAQRFPVLVWIYGGAFKSGSSAQPIYDGAYLAQQGVVVVTFNYRVGALGFLGGIGGLGGNYGFLDQQLALRWVKTNITRFGGDPNRVTLAGESAGGAFVALHALSAPASQPLFQQAAMMSNPLGLPYKTPAQARKIGLWYLAATGCYFNLEPAGCLRKKSVQEVLKGETSRYLAVPVLKEGLATFITWAPTIDGTILTRRPLAAAQSGGLTKPSIIGTNSDEGVLFAAGLADQPVGRIVYGGLLSLLLGDAGNRVVPLYPADGNDYRPAMERFITDYLFFCPNQWLAGAAKAPVYTYEFTHPPSVPLWSNIAGCKDKACHSEGLPFWFGNLDAVGIRQPEEEALSRDMAARWVQFAKGEPLTGTGGPEWPQFSQGGQYLRFDLPPSVFVPDRPQCATLDAIGYEQKATLERLDQERTRQNR
jgi:carboxylesterase type B